MGAQQETAVNLELLDRLCARCGVETAYRDAWGEPRTVPPETRLALLGAMGVTVASDADIERALEQREANAWRQPLPAVRVIRAGHDPLHVDITLSEDCAGLPFEWTLVTEQGVRSSGSFVPRNLPVTTRRRIAAADFAAFRLTVPAIPATGYHRFDLRAPGEASAPRAAMTLIVAPQRC
jgi:4-alpha-glucanotransferase